MAERYNINCQFLAPEIQNLQNFLKITEIFWKFASTFKKFTFQYYILLGNFVTRNMGVS